MEEDFAKAQSTIGTAVPCLGCKDSSTLPTQSAPTKWAPGPYGFPNLCPYCSAEWTHLNSDEKAAMGVEEFRRFLKRDKKAENETLKKDTLLQERAQAFVEQEAKALGITGSKVVNLAPSSAATKSKWIKKKGERTV